MPYVANGLIIGPREWSSQQNLTFNATQSYVFYNGQESIVLGTGLTGNLVADLPAYGSATNPLETGATYTVLITAKSPSSETINIGVEDNDGGGGTLALSLTPQYKTYFASSFIAPASSHYAGIFIGRATNTAPIFIQSVQWVKNQAIGYGTPSSAVITANLAGTAATTAQIGGTLSALILELQALGILGR